MKMYSNDETDKSTRQRDFYLGVYLLPILAVAAMAGLTYWAWTYNYIDSPQVRYIIAPVIFVGTAIYGANRKHWLKMPDGTYHNIKGISVTPKMKFNEPSEYEAEFMNSKKESAVLLAVGLSMIIFSVLATFKAPLLPIILASGGAFFIYTGAKRFLDKTPHLKVAKTGLWTRKLGFIHWDDMNRAQVIEVGSGKDARTCLDIYLKGTIFEEANEPDERLIISNLTGFENVEIIVDTAIINYNKLKAPSIA